MEFSLKMVFQVETSIKNKWGDGVCWYSVQDGACMDSEHDCWWPSRASRLQDLWETICRENTPHVLRLAACRQSDTGYSLSVHLLVFLSVITGRCRKHICWITLEVILRLFIPQGTNWGDICHGGVNLRCRGGVLGPKTEKLTQTLEYNSIIPWAIFAKFSLFVSSFMNGHILKFGRICSKGLRVMRV